MLRRRQNGLITLRLHEILAEKGKPSCQLGKALEIVRVLGMKLEIHGS